MKHTNLKHSPKAKTNEGDILCKICGESFREKWNLMRHRKKQHISFVAPCRNEIDGKCSYTSEMCWWNHSKAQNYSNENIICYKCSETFESKTDMMVHRKKKHASSVRICFKFAQNNCYYKNNSCWFLHEEEEIMDTDDIVEVDDRINIEEESVFQKVSENLRPPIQKKQKLD